MAKEKQSDRARIAALERELAQTKAAYAEAKLGKDMYLKMIHIAEEMFDIDIEKKLGAKQLRKDDGTTRSQA